MDQLVGIGAAARTFGLAESALRYWEGLGLVRPARRRSDRRLYGPDELHRIGLIHMWRETGLLSLAEIAAILAARDGSWQRAVRARIAAIEADQQRLATAKEHLEHLLTCTYDNPAEDCPQLRAMTLGTPGDMMPQ